MKSTRALTLLECAFAAFLFSSILVAIFAAWPTYARAADQNRTRVGGLFLARQEMEYAISQGFAAVAARTRSVTMTATVAGNTLQTPYQCALQVTNLSPDLKALHVQVTWQQSGRSQEVSCDSILAR